MRDYHKKPGTPGDILQHHGVKGQKWGVRREGSSSSTLAKHGELTTEGRSFIKKAMGDKTYWKRAGIITAAGLAAVATAPFAPGLLPVAMVASAGGSVALATTITGVSLTAMRVANMVNYSNYIRNRSGFIKHADLQTSELTVQEAYDSMNAEQTAATAILIAAAVKGLDVSADKGLAEAWQSMSDEQRAAAYFLGIVATTSDSVMAHSAVDAVLEHSGVRGMKWGIRRRVDPSTGLVARTSSADQISVDRIAKKLHSGGVSALSNKDLQEFSTRIQREQEFNRALSSQEAQRSKPFIQRFLATQGKRQFTRVTDKAIDIAVEKALQSAGIQIGKKGGKAKDLADILTETGVRLKPKKKGGG